MTVYFTKIDDFILFHFNMKKLNMFNFHHVKMMKISFKIIRHHCFVLATTYLCILEADILLYLCTGFLHKSDFVEVFFLLQIKAL